MKTLRVLHVVHSLDPGGMENGVVNIANGLAARSVECRIACLERHGAFAERLREPAGVVTLGKSGGFSAMAVWRLAREIARWRPHVVHSHNLGPLIYASLATLGGRMASLVHGEHSALAKWELEKRRIDQRRTHYRSCRAIHTVAESTRAQLTSLGFDPAKIVTLPNGVDLARFSPGERRESRERLGLPPSAFVAGIVGRFGPHKGHGALLGAFDSIAAQRLDLHLLVAGSGGPCEEETRRRAAASPWKERIHFTGLLAEPREAYRALDVLALPSTNEGMSNAALEAMACGVPVLAATGQGHEEVVTPECGFVRDVSTPDRLAGALVELAGEGTRLVDFGQRARKRIEADFSLERMLERYHRFYSLHVPPR